MATHFSILPGEFHGQRSLAEHSPWGHKESDTTEQLTLSHRTSKEALVVKTPPANAGDPRSPSLCRKDPLEKEMATHSSILAWKSHGQRSLGSYSPWGCKELDVTERLN